jgi:hypothetical protein
MNLSPIGLYKEAGGSLAAMFQATRNRMPGDTALFPRVNGRPSAGTLIEQDNPRQESEHE